MYIQNVKKKTMAQTSGKRNNKKERESNISIKCKEVIRHWIKCRLNKSHRIAVCLSFSFKNIQHKLYFSKCMPQPCPCGQLDKEVL